MIHIYTLNMFYVTKKLYNSDINSNIQLSSFFVSILNYQILKNEYENEFFPERLLINKLRENKIFNIYESCIVKFRSKTYFFQPTPNILEQLNHIFEKNINIFVKNINDDKIKQGENNINILFYRGKYYLIINNDQLKTNIEELKKPIKTRYVEIILKMNYFLSLP